MKHVSSALSACGMHALCVCVCVCVRVCVLTCMHMHTKRHVYAVTKRMAKRGAGCSRHTQASTLRL